MKFSDILTGFPHSSLTFPAADRIIETERGDPGVKEKRLKEHWTLQSRILDGGKEVREAVYTGKYYTLKDGARPLLGAGLAGFMLYLACALAFLSLNLAGTRCLYVLPVFLCGLFPAAYWAMGLFALWRAPEKMNVTQKEKGPARVMKSALGCAVCSGAALIGDIILMLTARPEKEWICALLLAGAFAAAAAVFPRLKTAEMTETAA